jgi:hypothetical protein
MHSARSTLRLKTILNMPAKTKPQKDGQHLRPRGVRRKREELAKKLNTISQINSHLACPAIGSASSMKELLGMHEPNTPLCQAVNNFKQSREHHVANELPPYQL